MELLHLVFNISALWSIGIVEQTPMLGTMYYLKITSLLFLLSPVICLALYHAAIKVAGREDYRTVTAVGYSCVLFGWMTVLAVRQPGGITMLPLFGFAGLPMFLAPFASLAITSLLIPRASFVGHLSGIIAGYLCAIPLVDFIPAWAAVGALCVAAAGMTADWAAHQGSGSGGTSFGGLGFPNLRHLRARLGLGADAAQDVESAPLLSGGRMVGS